MPTLSSTLRPQEDQEGSSADNGEEGDEVNMDEDPAKSLTETPSTLHIVGDGHKPAWGDYATLTEILQAGFKQSKVQVPIKIRLDQNGVVRREEMYPCRNCCWVSCSKAEEKRHKICFHSSEPLETIRQRMVELASQPECESKDPVAALEEEKKQVEGSLTNVPPCSDAPKKAKKTGVKKRPAAAEPETDISASGDDETHVAKKPAAAEIALHADPKIPEPPAAEKQKSKDNIDDDSDHCIHKVKARRIEADGSKWCEVSYADASLSNPWIPESMLPPELVSSLNPPEASNAPISLALHVL